MGEGKKTGPSEGREKKKFLSKKRERGFLTEKIKGGGEGCESGTAVTSFAPGAGEQRREGESLDLDKESGVFYSRGQLSTKT